MRRLFSAVIFVVAVAIGVWQVRRGDVSSEDPSVEQVATDNATDNAAIERAFDARRSDVQVRGEGTVTRILADDNDGSRHQRFIVSLPSGHTLLIAHNIDLAPRVAGLRAGDRIAFNGEYEWNATGGVIHWTHHDPAGRHEAGWLRHQGETYQ